MEEALAPGKWARTNEAPVSAIDSVDGPMLAIEYRSLDVPQSPRMSNN